MQQRRSFWRPWKKQKRRSRNNGDSSCNALQLKMNETYDYIIKDYTGSNKNDKTVLLEGGKRVPQLLPTREEAIEYAKIPKKSRGFDVGRYDEDRRGMYTSSLFLEEGSNAEANRRTIHIGVDIGAPVGTPVYAFEDGVVHSAGYNADVGDYGHVIVIEHHLKNSDDESTKVYALYGHLAAKGIQDTHPGQKIVKGQVIGYLGDTSENGGWTGECQYSFSLLFELFGLIHFLAFLGAHVHFQLAVNPPPTHDMPGVVALGQRDTSLLEYPDPRYVLGELY
jgi:murein DD-endopeptidase MepM/ murein hydrolase activator NlpD